MEWTDDKPIVPGYYVWKKNQVYAGSVIHKRIARIIEFDGKLMIDFNDDGNTKFVELKDITHRTWLKIG